MDDEVDKSTVACDSNDVHKAEWQGDPDVCGFQPGNPIQDKVYWCQTGGVGPTHSDE